MTDHDDVARFSRWPGLLALTFGVVGPPMAVLINEVVSYALTPWACQNDMAGVLHVVPICFLFVTAAAGIIALRDWRRTGRGTEDAGGSVIDRSRFIALLGVTGSVFFALIIIAQWIPIFVFGPCQVS